VVLLDIARDTDSKHLLVRGNSKKHLMAREESAMSTRS